MTASGSHNEDDPLSQHWPVNTVCGQSKVSQMSRRGLGLTGKENREFTLDVRNSRMVESSQL